MDRMTDMKCTGWHTERINVGTDIWNLFIHWPICEMMTEVVCHWFSGKCHIQCWRFSNTSAKTAAAIFRINISGGFWKLLCVYILQWAVIRKWSCDCLEQGHGMQSNRKLQCHQRRGDENVSATRWLMKRGGNRNIWHIQMRGGTES